MRETVALSAVRRGYADLDEAEQSTGLPREDALDEIVAAGGVKREVAEDALDYLLLTGQVYLSGPSSGPDHIKPVTTADTHTDQ